jgi:DNA (cytosine-5)-methyltransferase 1
MLTVGSLFAGIGGMELGLERTGGFRTVWQVELDPFARRVLAKHWPDVRRWHDVRSFPPGDGADWRCDLICGGFPCQDISLAGKGAGLAGPQSSLWFEFARVLRLLRPRFVIVENSPALANRGLPIVLGALADMGFDAEWAVLPASAFGACHIRARLFVVAYPQRGGRHGVHERQQAGRLAPDAGYGRAAGTDRPPAPDPAPDAPDADRPSRAVREEQVMLVQQPAPVGSGWWAAEPDVVRVVDGVPGRVDRIRCLGNAVVPQVAEWLGRRILAFDEGHCSGR